MILLSAMNRNLHLPKSRPVIIFHRAILAVETVKDQVKPPEDAGEIVLRDAKTHRKVRPEDVGEIVLLNVKIHGIDESLQIVYQIPACPVFFLILPNAVCVLCPRRTNAVRRYISHRQVAQLTTTLVAVRRHTHQWIRRTDLPAAIGAMIV